MSSAVTAARTRAVAYVRVSTDKQADHGVSLEAQQAKIAAYAQLYELDLVETVVDAGASAKTLARPGLQRALALLQEGAAQALLVVKLDRLTRSVRDLGELVDTYFAPGKAALLSVGEQFDTRNAAGRMVMNLLTVISQWEREAIGERTAAAMQHMAAAGEYTGGAAPYGHAVGADGKLQEVAAEQQVVAAARVLRAAGLTLQKVADELAAAGHRSRTGRVFLPVQIARMLE